MNKVLSLRIFSLILSAALIFSAAGCAQKIVEVPETEEEVTEEALMESIEFYTETQTESEALTELESTIETTTKKRITKSKKITALKNKLDVDKEPPKIVIPKPKPKPKPSAKVKYILNVPTVMQYPKYPMGCEAASATSVMNYYKVNVTMDEMINAIPREELYEENGKVYGPDISVKFAGNPMHKASDDCPGFGAYSPVITNAMNSVLARKGAHYRAKNITGCSFETLLAQLRNKNPVVAWSTYKMRAPNFKDSWYVKNPDGTERIFRYPTMMHIMVIYGYDDKNIYLMDPILGNVSYPLSTYKKRWTELGKQAVIMTKYTPPATTEPQFTLPDYTRPDYTKPDYTKPDYTRPDYTKPDYTRPDYTMPDFTKPDFTLPDFTNPSIPSTRPTAPSTHPSTVPTRPSTQPSTAPSTTVPTTKAPTTTVPETAAETVPHTDVTEPPEPALD